MSRVAALVFAIAAYAIFFATFLYLIVFVGDLAFATLTVDEGPAADAISATFIDLGLIALFGIQHSVMARQGFKRWWLGIVPPPLERSVYVLVTSAILILLFLLWRPIDTVVWNVTTPALHDILWVLFWLGWLTVLVSTFLINHFELFGLQQAWFHLRRREAASTHFREPFLYKWVRHPMMAGFFLAFWAAPEMTVGHLLLAGGMSLYILIAIRYEEHDLVSMLGRDYELYRERVGMLTPKIRRRGPDDGTA